METKEQYVIYPHPTNDEKQPDLTPQDKLIYLAIRRYMNKESMTAFPSYERITQDVGAVAKTIKKCVDNLVTAGYLEVEKKGRGLMYRFNNEKKFEPFSYDFIDKPELSFTEKAYIVASQQYMFKDEETKEGKISFTNKELSNLIHMPAATISKCNRSLEKKGYLEGASDNVKRFQMRELDQLIIWKLKDHEERINNNERDIALIKKQLMQLELENANLKKQLEVKNSYVM